MRDLRTLQAVLYSVAGGYACILLLFSVCFVRADPGQPADPECKTLLNCSEGQLCRNGTCEPLEIPIAGAGESCVDADCPEGFMCNAELICVEPGEKPQDPITCESISTKRAVAAVIEQCDSQNPDKSFVGGCPTEEFTDRMMDDETFDLLFRAWRQDMFTVVFPPPKEFGQKRWKDARETLIAQLESRKAKLGAATVIFVVARLGLDGDVASDEERGRALTRAQWVRETIKAMVSSESEIGYKTRPMGLSPKRLLQPGKFRDFIAESAYGFDEQTTAEIRNGTTNTTADINRSVHVILYPCSLEAEEHGD